MPESQGRDSASRPVESRRETGRLMGGGFGRIAPYLAVALLSLALGAGGALLLVRFSGGEGKKGMPGAASSTGDGQAGHESMPGMAKKAPVEQLGERSSKAVYISPARQQLIGVRTATVTRRLLDSTIRTVGMLAYDETRTTMINTKIAGWVDRLHVDYVGKSVRRGQPLLDIYSPDLVATQKEYLLAIAARNELGNSKIPEVRRGVDDLVSSARDRLTLWDISGEQIERLERTRRVQRTLTLYAPFDGIVLERNAFAGQYITPEMTTFKIADLSTIWVVAQVFEYEARGVKLGQESEIEFPYGQATRRLKGKISFIYPDVDPQTRRVKVRVEFPNPGFEFKPETYVTVVIRSSAAQRLAVPKEAVIDTGAKRYAIVALPDGYFEPREIEVGEPVDEFFPILRGFVEGEKVAVSAQFLIDSETNLQAAMQAMSMSMPGMDMGGGSTEGMEKPKNQAPAPKQVTPPDHSQHRPGGPEPKMDHSGHGGMEGMDMGGGGMEGMEMPKDQAPAPQQVPPADRSQHRPAGPEPKMDHSGHGR